jgi:4-amino-4-deoxy-L-arabinose transferase-like glycosyltransferase
MLADRDWLVPKSGGRPWLESPPLPQWITVGVAALAGGADREWVVRVAPAVMGTIVVLLTAWMAAGWYGRTIGLLAGLIAATTSELTRYSWLAEDEIFLCALVTIALALFVRMEFFGGLRAEHEPFRVCGLRPRGMLWFFVALGATNLAKGVLFGTVITLIPIGSYLLWNHNQTRIRAYLWFWGLLAAVIVGSAWPAIVMQRYPDVAQVWFYDQFGRVSGDYTDINEPWWYYAARLPEILAPWIFVVPFGMWLTARDALRKRYSPARFLWCWALGVPLVLSIPGGKHHHYLLHAVVPWCVLSAIALVWLYDHILRWPAWTRNPLGAIPVVGIPGAVAVVLVGREVGWPIWATLPFGAVWIGASVLISYGMWHSTARVATATLFSAVAFGYVALHVVAGQYFDRYRHDASFLKQVRRDAPSNRPLLVNAGMGQLEAFHTLFYLDSDTRTLHNLSFLVSAEFDAPEVFVITYSSDEEVLKLFGEVEVVFASQGTWRDGKYNDRLTLFRVHLNPALAKRQPNVRISPMQAMSYAPGPYLCELPAWAQKR